MRTYQTFMLSDEPRIAGIPLTTGIPVFLCTFVGMLIGYAYQLFLVGSILSVIMHFQFGVTGIRFFLSIIYWSLPRALTCLIFRAASHSANRQFIR